MFNLNYNINQWLKIRFNEKVKIFDRYNKINDLLNEMYIFNKQNIKTLFEEMKKYIKDKITLNRIFEVLNDMPKQKKNNFQILDYHCLNTDHLADLKSLDKIIRKVDTV